MTLTAIETRYAGYRFRSRLEARWAVYFDAMRWKWTYEAEGFDLGGAGLYLPDFRIEDRLFIEVKPTLDAVDPRTDSVCESLCEQSKSPVWILVGSPGECSIYVIEPTKPGLGLFRFGIPANKAGNLLTSCRWCGGPVAVRSVTFCERAMSCRPGCPSTHVDDAIRSGFERASIIGSGAHRPNGPIEGDYVKVPEWYVDVTDILFTVRRSALAPIATADAAIAAARGARFEHGERGS